jgi:putative transposase
MVSTAKTYRNQCIVALYELGKVTQQEVANVFQVSQGLVSQIYRRYCDQGEAGLVGTSAPGAPAKLTATQREQLGRILDQGAVAYGFEGERWTRKRVSLVIQQEFGVTYEVSSVGRLLNALKFSRQRPITKDRRQRETEVTEWKETTLPEIKKRPRRSSE